MWLGQDREIIHIRAKKGSDGVGFLIKQPIFDTYNANIIDDNHEGILWLKSRPNLREQLCTAAHVTYHS